MSNINVNVFLKKSEMFDEMTEESLARPKLIFKVMRVEVNL